MGMEILIENLRGGRTEGRLGLIGKLRAFGRALRSSLKSGAALRQAQGTLFSIASKAVGKIGGGEGGIRTPGTREGTPDFESGTFGHSVTSPSEGRKLAGRL